MSEILYYLKNISHIENQGTSFLLNDSDYKKIISLSKNLSSSSILLFWDFTIKTIKEINKSEAEKILKDENEKNLKAQSSADVPETKPKTSEKKPKKAPIKKKAKTVSKK